MSRRRREQQPVNDSASDDFETESEEHISATQFTGGTQRGRAPQAVDWGPTFHIGGQQHFNPMMQYHFQQPAPQMAPPYTQGQFTMPNFYTPGQMQFPVQFAPAGPSQSQFQQRPQSQFPVSGSLPPLRPTFAPPTDQWAPRSPASTRSSSQSRGSDSTAPSSSTGSTGKKGRTHQLVKLPEVSFDNRLEIHLDGPPKHRRFVVVGNHPRFTLSGHVSGEIGAIVKNNFTEAACTAEKVSNESYALWWNMFERRFRWPPEQDHEMKVHVHNMFRRKVSDMMYEAHTRKRRDDEEEAPEAPGWVQTPEQWDAIIKQSAEENFRKIRTTNKKNRMKHGKTGTHSTGRKCHLDMIAEQERLLNRPLRMAERFGLCYGVKPKEVQENTPPNAVQVHPPMQDRYAAVLAKCEELFGPDNSTWPPNAADQVVVHLDNPVYKSYIPGFPHLDPVELGLATRRSGGISIGLEARCDHGDLRELVEKQQEEIMRCKEEIRRDQEEKRRDRELNRTLRNVLKEMEKMGGLNMGDGPESQAAMRALLDNLDTGEAGTGTSAPAAQDFDLDLDDIADDMQRAAADDIPEHWMPGGGPNLGGGPGSHGV